MELPSLLVLPPELLIVDLEMPVMDGVELIELLQQRKLSIPLIVASSREVVLINAVETMARNRGFPVVGGLRKPLERASRAAAFDGWDRRQAAQAPVSSGAPGSKAGSKARTRR